MICADRTIAQTFCHAFIYLNMLVTTSIGVYMDPYGQTLKILGIVLIVCGTVLYGAMGGAEYNPAAIVGVLVMIAGVLLHFRGRRQSAKAIATGPNNPLSDDKPDVLYLRSFSTDPSSITKQLMTGFSTDEEQLAVVLRPFGDLIAIGQPGEPLPLPGATRVYASNAEWQRVVLDRMRSSALVIIRAGAGPGLIWEFGQAFRHVSPERLLILILRTSAADYAPIVSMAKTEFGIILPYIARSSFLSAAIDLRDGPSKLQPGFIRFYSGWVAEFLPLRQKIVRLGYNDLLESFNLALQPVFDAHGIRWRRLTRFATSGREAEADES